MDRKSQLKNLMKKERQDRTQKIDSPLAKYNSAGQLLCILCQTPVQADALWDTHCKSKKHLENLVALKQAKAAKQSTAAKRTASELPSEDEQPAKRVKVTPLSQTPVPAPATQTEPEPESSALVTYGEEEQHEGEDEGGLDPDTVAQLEREMMSEDEINKLIAQSRATQQSEEIEVEVNLPEGFFDAQHAERAVKTVKQAPPQAATSDAADNEWDKYQASLQVTSGDVSNARPDETEDDTRQEDDIDAEPIENEIHEELEQQQSLLSRLMEIKKKAAEQLSQPKKAVPKEVQVSDEDEDDADPFDWRAKGF